MCKHLNSAKLPNKNSFKDHPAVQKLIELRKSDKKLIIFLKETSKETKDKST